jgi:hypothetical protein
MEADRSLAVALAADPNPLRAGGKVAWRVTLTNRSARAETLTFPTAQLADVILEQMRGERYRWSDGRMFAQVLTEQRLEPGETWTAVLDDTLEVQPGVYVAVALVTCSPQPPPVQAEMRVEARS